MKKFNFTKQAGEFILSEYRAGTVLRDIQAKMYALKLVDGTIDTSTISAYATIHGCTPRNKKRVTVGTVTKIKDTRSKNDLIDLVSDVLSSNVSAAYKTKILKLVVGDHKGV